MLEDDTLGATNAYVYEYPSPLIDKIYSIDELAENLRLVLTNDGVIADHKEAVGGLVVSLLVKYERLAEVVDLTPQVEAAVARARIEEGVCTVYVRHATAAIVINENADPGFRLDILAALDTLFPEGIWAHDKVDDDGAAHLKAALLGPSEAIPVRAGRLLLGTGQGVALVECDGPRERGIVIDIRG